MNERNLRECAIHLRQRGHTYASIREVLGVEIPKSTLSGWLKHVSIPDEIRAEMKERNRVTFHAIRQKALAANRYKREMYFSELMSKNESLLNYFSDSSVRKIILSVLYLGEGSKNPRLSRISFGNSDPRIIKLFLSLLREVYSLDETKFRCTVQCRADQSPESLTDFWSEITAIPLAQFYNTQVDIRTLGKPSRKSYYKGVCRIDYLSAELFHEIMCVGKIITGAHSSAG